MIEEFRVRFFLHHIGSKFIFFYLYDGFVFSNNGKIIPFLFFGIKKKKKLHFMPNAWFQLHISTPSSKIINCPPYSRHIYEFIIHKCSVMNEWTQLIYNAYVNSLTEYLLKSLEIFPKKKNIHFQNRLQDGNS